VAGKDAVLDWEEFHLAFDGDPEVNIYRNETVLPRALVVYRVLAAADQQAAWDLIHRPDFEPASTVVLEGIVPAGMDVQVSGEPLPGISTAHVVRYGTDSLEIEVETPVAGMLVLSDPYYSGWQAEVDGQPVEILRANYAFRAVAVPSGIHRVTMAFRPATWRVGLVITLSTLLLLLAVGAVLVWRRRVRS
jgi:hypothetical protein